MNKIINKIKLCMSCLQEWPKPMARCLDHFFIILAAGPPKDFQASSSSLKTSVCNKTWRNSGWLFLFLCVDLIPGLSSSARVHLQDVFPYLTLLSCQAVTLLNVQNLKIATMELFKTYCLCPWLLFSANQRNKHRMSYLRFVALLSSRGSC